MLEHPHADQSIVLLGSLDVPVIQDLHTTAIRQAGLTNTGIGQFCLWLADRDAECLHPVMLRSIDEQPPPTAADIQETLTTAEPQLTAKVVQFAFLRRIKIVNRRREIGTGIDHPFIEPEGIEVVRDIVVIDSRLPVARLRMQGAAQLRCLAANPRTAFGRQAEKILPVAQLLSLSPKQGE